MNPTGSWQLPALQHVITCELTLSPDSVYKNKEYTLNLPGYMVATAHKGEEPY